MPVPQRAARRSVTILFRCRDVLFRIQKKYRPPRPMGVKGGCSPQNNRENWAASTRAWGRWQQNSAGNLRTYRGDLQDFANIASNLKSDRGRVLVATPAIALHLLRVILVCCAPFV
jgi:hypothetical protein